MQSAFLLGRIFPPPTPAAFMLVGQNRPGARFAADADVAALVQFVVRHLVGFDIIPDLGGSPV